ncbi:hypothetical protein ACFO0M_00890 [Micromonospora mangrovi]|uniref:Uncharacterized protein n=2 Tax=Micromonospora TaxID=1873 RepID=A0AAU7MAR8_9ACTN
MPSSLQDLIVAAPVLAYLVGSAVALYAALLALTTLVATLHSDKERRADARRALTALLSIIPIRRR